MAPWRQSRDEPKIYRGVFEACDEIGRASAERLARRGLGLGEQAVYAELMGRVRREER